MKTTCFSLACWNWGKCATPDLGRSHLFLLLIPFWQLFILSYHKSLPKLESTSVRLTAHFQKQSGLSSEGSCEKDKPEWHVSWMVNGVMRLRLRAGRVAPGSVYSWAFPCRAQEHGKSWCEYTLLTSLTNLSTTALFYSKSFVLNITFNNFTDQINLDSPQLQINRGPPLGAQWNAGRIWMSIYDQRVLQHSSRGAGREEEGHRAGRSLYHSVYPHSCS